MPTAIEMQLQSPTGCPKIFSPFEGEITKQNLSMMTGGDSEKFMRTVSEGTTHVPDDFVTSPMHGSASMMSATASIDAFALSLLPDMDSEPYKLVRTISGGVNKEAGEAMRDGPALTSDGRAVDLDGGRAMWFSHGPNCVHGNRRKNELKSDVRHQRDMQVAHAACEAEERINAGEASPIDKFGTLHSVVPIPLHDVTDMPARLKKLRQKRMERRRPDLLERPYLLCVGPDGKVILNLVFRNNDEKRVRRLRKIAAWRQSQVPDVSEKIIVLDTLGVIQV